MAAANLVFKPCPFLGCMADRATVCGYPTGANVCYARSTRRVAFSEIPHDHQEFHCLAAFAECRSYSERLAILGSGGTTPARTHPGHGLARWFDLLLGR